MEDKKNVRMIFEEWIQDALEFTGESFWLSDDSQYEELVRHIQDHKYLANQKIPRELTIREAVYSWYEQVYEPLVRALDKAGVVQAVEGKSRTELFLLCSRHWHHLKEKYGPRVPAEKAVLDLAARMASTPMRRMGYRLWEQVA